MKTNNVISVLLLVIMVSSCCIKKDRHQTNILNTLSSIADPEEQMIFLENSFDGIEVKEKISILRRIILGEYNAEIKRECIITILASYDFNGNEFHGLDIKEAFCKISKTTNIKIHFDEKFEEFGDFFWKDIPDGFSEDKYRNGYSYCRIFQKYQLIKMFIEEDGVKLYSINEDIEYEEIRK